MNLLSPVFNWAFQRRFDTAAKHHSQRLMWKGPIPFDAAESNDQYLSAWAALKFGRNIHPKAAKLLHQLVSLFGLRDVQVLYHGDIAGREERRFRIPQRIRWVFACLAIAYVPIALFGAVAFSILIFRLDAPVFLKVFLAALIHVAFLGQALHGLLILVEPLRIHKRIENSFHSEVLS